MQWCWCGKMPSMRLGIRMEYVLWCSVVLAVLRIIRGLWLLRRVRLILWEQRISVRLNRAKLSKFQTTACALSEVSPTETLRRVSLKTCISRDPIQWWTEGRFTGCGIPWADNLRARRALMPIWLLAYPIPVFLRLKVLRLNLVFRLVPALLKTAMWRARLSNQRKTCGGLAFV